MIFLVEMEHRRLRLAKSKQKTKERRATTVAEATETQNGTRATNVAANVVTEIETTNEVQTTDTRTTTAEGAMNVENSGTMALFSCDARETAATTATVMNAGEVEITTTAENETKTDEVETGAKESRCVTIIETRPRMRKAMKASTGRRTKTKGRRELEEIWWQEARERLDRQVRSEMEGSFEERGVNRFRALLPQGLTRVTANRDMTEVCEMSYRVERAMPRQGGEC